MIIADGLDHAITQQVTDGMAEHAAGRIATIEFVFLRPGGAGVREREWAGYASSMR
jgi:hypothetical protein